MALQLAGHGLDSERKVVLFFNVRAADIPTKSFPETIAFKDQPIKKMLADLIERGAEVHVCPHCMQALAVNPDALIAGAQVTDREALFSNITSNTVVFTY
jgi:predicted peroxiredoxin